MVRGLKMENLNPRDNGQQNIPSEASCCEDSEYLIRIEIRHFYQKL